LIHLLLMKPICKYVIIAGFLVFCSSNIFRSIFTVCEPNENYLEVVEHGEVMALKEEPLNNELAKLREDLAASKQIVRELSGQLKKLEASKDVKNNKDESWIRDDLWADYGSYLESSRYQCISPRKNHSIWKPLMEVGNAICGCLFEAQIAKNNCYRHKPPKKVCNVFWFVIVGDSTSNLFLMSLRNLLLTDLNYKEIEWRSQEPKANAVHGVLDKVRSHRSNKAGELVRFDNDFGFERPGYPTVILSLRRAHGISLSKWQAILSNPYFQYQTPASKYPVLDEPYFVPMESQLNRLLPQSCGRIEPNLVLGGTALWDTFFDSNMNHRVENARCGMKIPDEVMAKRLYDERLPALFNMICKYTSNFVWKTSNMAPRFNIHKGENKLHQLDYKLTGYFNNKSRAVAEFAGVPILDFENIHRELNFPGLDRVHAPSFVDYQALVHLFSGSFISKICSDDRCQEMLSLIRNGANKSFYIKKKEFWDEYHKKY